MSGGGLALDARTIGVVLSRRARTLLSRATMNDLAREGLAHGGDEWIATWLRRRFDRVYASVALGYRTSARRDPWAARRNLPPTYDDRKRAYQGHADPLVWTGRLRQEALRGAVTRTTATGGNARGRITFGRLSVRTPSGGFVAPRRVVIDTLLGGPSRRLPAAEVATIRRGFVAYAQAVLAGVSAPQKRPIPAPPAIVERRAQRLAEARRAQSAAAGAADAVRDFGRARRARAAQRLAAWRGDAGGSVGTGALPMTAAERRLAHRAQARASYRRRRVAINARRRLRARAT